MSFTFFKYISFIFSFPVVITDECIFFVSIFFLLPSFTETVEQELEFKQESMNVAAGGSKVRCAPPM